MVDSKPGSGPQSPPSAPKPSAGRQRVISSCLTCRRRKVKCDHVHPVCGACMRGGHVCTWTDQMQPQQTVAGRVLKPTALGSGKMAKNSDVQSRLDRLELLLERAVTGQAQIAPQSVRSSIDYERKESDAQLTPSSNSQTSHGGGITSDDGDGTLLLDGGQSQFVSSLHYALLADEIQDIKAILGDKSDEEKRAIPQNTLIDLLSLGRAGTGSHLEQLLPHSQETRDKLLDIYFVNVDPVVRVTHKQSVIRKFAMYNRDTHPIAFALYFAAVNSLSQKAAVSEFNESKESLMNRFQLGIEISLARENYLTTSSLEVFQAFILWLTGISREEDMGKAWVLLGVAFRIALNQGLHRDPSLFPPGSMDALTIELRRRAWHQLCHLEYRAAECKGQEPSISDDFFTTMLPRNIDDEDLVEGDSTGPVPYDAERFTSMTFPLVRLEGQNCLRRIVQNTFRLERRLLGSGLHGTSRPDPAQELRSLYEEIEIMLREFNKEVERKYLRHCDPGIPLQRYSLNLATLLEWRCYLLFWLRMPRAYRDSVFSTDVRRSIFEKSINCIQTINDAAVDTDAARFHWHIAGVTSFQAIMHVLSELRNPLFDTPDRERAVSALKFARAIRESNDSKAWQAVKAMIDKCVAEHQASPRNKSHSSSSYASPPEQISDNTGPLEDTSSGSVTGYPTLGVSGYTHPTSNSLATGPLPVHMAHNFVPPPPMQPIQPLQSGPLNWDELNLSHINNIVGTVQPVQGIMPDLDFGYWGDPFSYQNDPAALPLEDNYFPQWTG